MKQHDAKVLKTLLADLNGLIDAMLQVVLPDFIQITEMLKYAQEKIKNESAELQQDLSEIITELQYYDTLCQRMEHIKKIHDLITSDLDNNYSDHGPVIISGVNLIRLNHLQFQVSCFDYLSTVNHIQSILTKHNLLILLGLKNIHEVFLYSNLILTASRKMNAIFLDADKKFQGSKALELHSKVDLIAAIYSMESERSVMYAYINKPLIRDEEIQIPIKVNTSQSLDVDLF